MEISHTGNSLPDYIIGIDPDVDKSGVATLHPRDRILETQCLGFADLLEYLQSVKIVSAKGGKSVVVIIEAGWLNQSNWHTNTGQNHRVAAKIGSYTGANAQVGKLLIEMSESYGLETIARRPLRKCWQGKNGKITHKELAYFTKLEGRTNQEERDSALLAWDYAGLPIKIKAKERL